MKKNFDYIVEIQLLLLAFCFVQGFTEKVCALTPNLVEKYARNYNDTVNEYHFLLFSKKKILGQIESAKENPDDNGLWALSQRPHLQIRIVIINNRGGMIFRHKFGHPLFENQHKLNFNHWAAMWGLNYKHWNTDIPEHFESSQNHIIEISVNS